MTSIQRIKPPKAAAPRHQTQPFQLPTTIHKDLTERLPQVHPQLANEARKVLDVNKSERHIRGGLATKDKYLREKGRHA